MTKEIYGVKDNKALVEVSPKTDTDVVAGRVTTLEGEMDAVQTKNTEQDTKIDKKVDKAQGSENAGKVLGVGTDGNVTLLNVGTKKSITSSSENSFVNYDSSSITTTITRDLRVMGFTTVYNNQYVIFTIDIPAGTYNGFSLIFNAYTSSFYGDGYMFQVIIREGDFRVGVSDSNNYYGTMREPYSKVNSLNKVARNTYVLMV